MMAGKVGGKVWGRRNLVMAKRKRAAAPAKAVEQKTAAELAAMYYAEKSQGKRHYAIADECLEQLLLLVKPYDEIVLKSGRIARVIDAVPRPAYAAKYEIRVSDK